MTDVFDDTSDGQIVDELGALKAQVSDLTKREKALKDEIIRRLDGFGVTEGALFRAAVSTSTTCSLDTKAIREKMPEAWLQAHSKQRETTTVRIGARTA